MPDILLDTYRLRQYAQRIEQINSRIEKVDLRLYDLYLQIRSPELLKLILSDVIPAYNWQLFCCKNYLDETADEFEFTENYLKEFDPTNFKPPTAMDAWLDFIQSKQNIWNPYIQSIQETARKKLVPSVVIGCVQSALLSMTTKAIKAFFTPKSVSATGSVWSTGSENGKNFFKVLTGTASASTELKYGEYKDKKAKSISKQDKPDVSWKKDTLPGEDFYEKKGTILEKSAEAKIEGSVLEAGIGGENKWAEGSLTGKLLTGEMHASVAAGLYVYEKDKDGNIKRVLAPGVSAEVGASVAVLQVEADGRIGLGIDKKGLGLYGNADAKALSAEAKAEASITTNEVYVGASAEADLAKVSATAGVSVLGTDIGVSGSLKVGVGAHAEVGITDGKLKVDVGAALGVGFDLGFEIDVSGTVNAIQSGATTVFNTVQDAATTVANTVSNMVTGTVNAIQSGATTVFNTVQGIGNSIAKGFGKLFHW